MDLERLHKLIEDDRLAEATGLLLATLQGTSLEKEARALRSRINDLERQVRQGLLGQEQAQIEKNRLRAAILDLAEDTGTPKDGLPKKPALVAPGRDLAASAVGGLVLVGGRSRRRRRC